MFEVKDYALQILNNTCHWARRGVLVKKLRLHAAKAGGVLVASSWDLRREKLGCTPFVRQKVKTLPHPVGRRVCLGTGPLLTISPVGEAEASTAGEQLAKE
jgi:hypothetical protein